MTAAAPSRFGRYEVVRALGRGAVGEVHLARDPTLGRLVAVKTLSGLAALPPGDQEEAREKFLREARAAAALSHPNIVTIYDVGEQDDLPYMAMEFLEGTTLDRHARKGHLLPPEKVIEIGIRAALALDEAHRAGLVHRDVKPANLILLEDGTVKVTDFGLAKDPRTALTSDQTIVGTPNYMSPEQIAGKGLDGRSDLFSLAVSLYELLAGALPFAGDTISSVLYRIVNERPVPLRDLQEELPEALEDLLETMMAKDREERLANGRDLASALRRILQSMGGVPEHLVIPPPSSVPRSGTSAGRSGAGAAAREEAPRRRRAWTRVVAAVLLLVGVAAALWTAPRWAGVDPLGGAREPVTAWLRDVLPAEVAESVAVAPAAARVPVRTEPEGVAWRVDGEGAAVRDGLLEVDPGTNGELLLVADDPCRAGETRVAATALPEEIVIATEPVLRTVRVTTRPAGATVSIDGEARAGVTPMDLSLEACGAHEVVITAGARPPRTVSLAAEGDESAWRAALTDVELAPPPPGFLVFAEAPYPVRVTRARDGRSLGRAGQRLQLDPGRYRIALVASDVQFAQEVTVTVASGETARPRIDYPPIGRLSVRAVPPGGDVLVRRPGGASARKIGETPLNGRALVAGTYDVVVEHPTRGVQVVRPAVVQGGGDATLVVVGAGDWP